MKLPLAFSAYQLESTNIANQELVNWYAEVHKAQDGTQDIITLHRTPGLEEWITLPDGPVREMKVGGDYLYVVSGETFYQVTTAGAYDDKGTVTNPSGHVSMTWNGTQVCVVDSPDGYVYTLGADTFAEITDADYLGSVKTDIMDGYNLHLDPDSDTWFISNLRNATAYTATDYADAESSEDPLVSCAVARARVWLFGTETTEIWYDVGGTGFPFLRDSGATMNLGCAATHSVALTPAGLMWLSRDERGLGPVVLAAGFDPRPVSTPAIDYQIGSYSVVSDAKAYAYQELGHSFYVLNFPTEGVTWCYDLTTGLWHRRSSLIANVYGRHWGQCHAYFGGYNLVGDYASGKIYRMDTSFLNDDGSEIQRVCNTIRADQEQKRVFFKSLQGVFEPGIGLNAGQGSDPQVMMQFSDDAGKTWSNEYWSSAGEIGEYEARVLYHALGSGRNRVFRFTVSDPVEWGLREVVADVEVGTW